MPPLTQSSAEIAARIESLPTPRIRPENIGFIAGLIAFEAEKNAQVLSDVELENALEQFESRFPRFFLSQVEAGLEVYQAPAPTQKPKPLVFKRLSKLPPGHKFGFF